MRIKNTVFMILVLLLVCLSTSALATLWYVNTPNGKSVNIRDQYNAVIGQIPYGESVIPEGDKCTETVAFVEYRGVSGYVKWQYLSQEKPEARKKNASQQKVESGTTVTYGEGQHTISVTGGVLQFQNKKKKATGTKYTEVKFDEPVSLVVTASIPKKKKIDYWVINGAKLQLKSKSFGIIGEDEDITIKIVYK